ncbi:MAG TPA: S4 domain-containing protein [Dongiaceae bacterium]|jgi:ribosome-associated heat shock protein Hsp15|nr:S4 domain-containing protein [Dongiaceae bacterium]
MRQSCEKNEARQRLDLFLWHARFARSRSEAQRIIARDRLRLNGRVVTKAHTTVQIGDFLTLAVGKEIVTICICGLAARRVSPALRGTLYTRLEARSGSTGIDDQIRVSPIR